MFFQDLDSFLHSSVPMQRLGALAFQSAAGGHLLGSRAIAGLEILVGK